MWRKWFALSQRTDSFDSSQCRSAMAVWRESRNASSRTIRQQQRVAGGSNAEDWQFEDLVGECSGLRCR